MRSFSTELAEEAPDDVMGHLRTDADLPYLDGPMVQMKAKEI